MGVPSTLFHTIGTATGPFGSGMYSYYYVEIGIRVLEIDIHLLVIGARTFSISMYHVCVIACIVSL